MSVTDTRLRVLAAWAESEARPTSISSPPPFGWAVLGRTLTMIADEIGDRRNARLVTYRAAACVSLADATFVDGEAGKTSNQRRAEAIERLAHAMLAAETLPKEGP